MPKFLSKDELYRVLQRELPPEVYADGAPSGNFTTADMDSVAKVVGTQYTNLQQIYYNMFPQTAVDYIQLWAVKIFGTQLDASLTLEEMRDQILARIRAKISMSGPSMLAIVKGVLGAGIDVEIWAYSSPDTNWLLGYSLLGFNTFLSPANWLVATGPLIYTNGYAFYGLTAEQWANNQYFAYSYEVRIYDYTPSALQLSQIDSLLTIYEPARSQHIIRSGLDPSTELYGGNQYA